VLALTLTSCFLLSRVTETRKDIAAHLLRTLAQAVVGLGRNSVPRVSEGDLHDG